jgi:hypothetical protein
MLDIRSLRTMSIHASAASSSASRRVAEPPHVPLACRNPLHRAEDRHLYPWERATTLDGVTLKTSSPVLRLGDLRRQRPGDATLQDLLAILDAKLELCRRLPVYEYDAAHDGDEGCASELRELLAVERQSCERVVEMLHRHLKNRLGDGAAAWPSGAPTPNDDDETSA